MILEASNDVADLSLYRRRTRWQAEAKNASQATAFVKWLIAKDYVTEYQASLLSKGLVDDFFLGQYEIMERIGRGRLARRIECLGRRRAEPGRRYGEGRTGRCECRCRHRHRW